MSKVAGVRNVPIRDLFSKTSNRQYTTVLSCVRGVGMLNVGKCVIILIINFNLLFSIPSATVPVLVYRCVQCISAAG